MANESGKPIQQYVDQYGELSPDGIEVRPKPVFSRRMTAQFNSVTDGKVRIPNPDELPEIRG